MGVWGIVYACILLPAIGMCLSTRTYFVLGVLMLAKWVCFTVPFRSLFVFGDDPMYFTVISATTAVLIYLFCYKLIVAKIIIGLLSLSILFAYSTLTVNYVNLHYAMIIAEVFGYGQILALYGGAGGELGRRFKLFKYSPVDANSGRFPQFRGDRLSSYLVGRDSAVGNQRIQDANMSMQGNDPTVEKE